MSVWIVSFLAFCCVCVLECWDPRARELKKTQVWVLLRNASFVVTHRFTYPSTRTVSFKRLYAPFHLNRAFPSTLLPLRVLFMSQNAEENGAQAEAHKTEHQRYAVCVTAISILTASAVSLNYHPYNAFNPLQCSVQFVFNVVHLPTNQLWVKTEHSNSLLQTQ